jgi:hypothetical protein
MSDIQGVIYVDKLDGTGHSKVRRLMFKDRHDRQIVVIRGCVDMKLDKIRTMALYFKAEIRLQDALNVFHEACYLAEVQTTMTTHKSRGSIVRCLAIVACPGKRRGGTTTPRILS